MSNASMVGVLDALRTNLRRQLEASRDEIGRNVVGLRILGRQVDEQQNAYLGDGGGEEEQLAKKIKTMKQGKSPAKSRV